jgi:hypothetical protein
MIPTMLARALPLLAALLAAPAAHSQSPGPSMGEHGMLLFGGHDGLFLSHLPMFHRPHDVQVVLKVHLADHRHERALRRQLAASLQVWTVVPERFELDRLAPQASQPLRSFHADVVQGHFERGGKAIYKGDEVIVDRVVFDHRLVPAGVPGPTLTYRVVDAGPGAREHFLVHWISTRPDADNVVRVITPAHARLPQQVELARGQTLAATPAALQEALRQQGSASARVDRSIYLETGDLQ